MLSTDRVSFFLGVGAIVVTLGVGMCSTNPRFDDLNGRFDDTNRRLDERFDGVDQRFDDHVADVNRRLNALGADVRGLRADHVRFDERLRAVEVAFGRVDQRLLTIERVVLPPAPAKASSPPTKPLPRECM